MTCDYDGCTNKRRNKGKVKGRSISGRFCDKHHRYRLSNNKGQRRYIDNSTCSRCGWDEAMCDRHRIDPDKGYYLENVAVLCPNCHRLITLNLITL